jgi:hypothetical protein
MALVYSRSCMRLLVAHIFLRTHVLSRFVYSFAHTRTFSRSVVAFSRSAYDT